MRKLLLTFVLIIAAAAGAWGQGSVPDGTVASVTISGTTSYYNTFASAANYANTANDAATVTLLDDISGYNFRLGNESADGVTLDLNGHSISGNEDVGYAIIVVDVNMKLTVTDSSTGTHGTISNSGDDGFGIINNGTLNVSGCTISGYHGITNNNGGRLTVGAGTTISGSSACIDSRGTLTLNALPTFGGADGRDADIWLGTDDKIGFADGFTVPDGNAIIKVNVGDNELPYAFTTGYDGNVIPASEVFALSGAADNVVTVVNAAGEVTFVEQPAPLTFAPAGYATYYNSQFAIALSAGMRAYTVTACSEANAQPVSTLTYDMIADGDDSNGVGNVVPAATAVLLSIDPSTAAATGDEASAAKTVSFTDNTKEAPCNNLLRGFDFPHLTEGGDFYYKLSYGTGDAASVFGWYYSEDYGGAFECAPHKAYLALPDNVGARFLALPGFDEANGIESLPQPLQREGSQAAVTSWHTLDGRRLSAKPATPGIYVHNGRKVAIK